VITVAFDKDPEDARPWIEKAKPMHPSLIDTAHLVADLYNIVNVPTILWIDEEGRIVRPNDVAFGDNTWKSISGLDAEVHANALRAWVRGEAPAFPPDRARDLQNLPTENDQLARAEFAVGRWLAENGRAEAAEPHFVRAGELAPHDFTIRRGSMPLRGINPMGPEFFKMSAAWQKAGNPYYRPLPEA
jgi:hypothetical protein